MSQVLMHLLLGLLSFAACEKGDVINVAENGADTKDCIEGKTPCLTVDYVIQNFDNDIAPAMVVVTYSQKISVSVYGFQFRDKITITGGKDIVFQCDDGVSFGFNFQAKWFGTSVNLTGIQFQNCAALVFIEVVEVTLQDCTVRNGGPVRFTNALWLTIDNCVFTNISTFGEPVIYNFMQSINIYPEEPKQPTIILQNSLIVDNWGYATSAQDIIGNGMLFFDTSLMLQGNITVLIENCNISNNIMSGKPAPLLSAEHSIEMYLNISINESIFLNNSIPLTILLTSTNGDIHLNVINSYFQNSSTPLGGHGLQIVQAIDPYGHSDVIDSSNTIHANFIGTRFEDDPKMKRNPHKSE